MRLSLLLQQLHTYGSNCTNEKLFCYNAQTAGMIYGGNFVRITEPTQLAETISSIIRRQLRDW